MPERRILVVSGSRADYGHLYWVMREIADDPDLELSVAVTGQQLLARFGETWREIEADGFAISAKIDIGPAGDAPLDAAHAAAAALGSFADLVDRLRPDLLVVLGDRFEIFAVTAAAFLMGVPVAHLHGGEITEGAMDDSLRHAISKLSHYHFVAAEPYRQRVIQMGEDPAAVFMTGAPGLDHLRRSDLPTRQSLRDAVGMDLSDRYLLVTYHPETAGDVDNAAAVAALVAALGEFREHGILLTGVNSDPGHDVIAETLHAFAAADPAHVRLVQSLGHRLYLTAAVNAGAIVGNSSSGVIEAPAIPTPSVNIGNRQKGRLRSPSIVDCGHGRAEISAAISRALDPSFRAGLRAPAEADGFAARRIKDRLKTVPTGPMAKRFFDMSGACDAL